MDTNLNISVDMGRVQSAVQAAIRPAVEEALGAYDIKAAIIEQLTNKPKKGREDSLEYTFLRYYGGREVQNTGSLLDSLVRDSVHALAKEYVEKNIRMQREEIEEAFRKMMNGSTNRLVKAFAAAVEGALKEDWGFNLKVEVEHKTEGRDDD